MEIGLTTRGAWAVHFPAPLPLPADSRATLPVTSRQLARRLHRPSREAERAGPAFRCAHALTPHGSAVRGASAGAVVISAQVRRPPASRGGRRAFISGKKKQNTMKATVIADWRGRTLWSDALRPGRMHDATAARNEGIAICFQHFPDVEVLLDDGYLGLSRDHRGQPITPPRKPRPGALPGRVEQWERDRHGHSSDRITVEHALADHKRWKQLTRWTYRRDVLPDTYRAIAGLVSDRTANV